MKRDIGELLVDNGQITEDELNYAREQAESASEPTGRILLRLGLLSEDNLKTVLELNYGVNYLNLKKTDPEHHLVSLMSKEAVLEYGAVPVSLAGNRLVLAMLDPADNESRAELSNYFNDRQVSFTVCSDDGFIDFIERAYPKQRNLKSQLGVKTESSAAEPGDLSQLPVIDKSVDEGRAIVLLSQHILANAITRGCTNIHIEPGERQILVHYRKEGVLFSARKLPRAILPDLVQRFKSMVSKGIAGTALPYDGLLNVTHNEQIFSFRLSIVPGTYGEHLVIWLE